MPFIRCDVTECAYNDENGECVADLIQMDYDGCLTFEEAESEDKCKNCEYSRNPDYTRCHECGAKMKEGD